MIKPVQSRHRADDNQGVAETEFLDRDPKQDRHNTAQQGADPGHEQQHHHQIHPNCGASEASLLYFSSRARQDKLLNSNHTRAQWL